MPSFTIMELAINEFIPSSLLEPNFQKMKTFFEVTSEILQTTTVCKLIPLIKNPTKIVNEFVEMIMHRKINECSSREQDSVLSGLFETTSILLVKFPEVRIQLSRKGDLVRYLTHQGLF